MSALRYLSIISLTCIAWAGQPNPAASNGEALYRGKVPLQGNIREQQDMLPPEAIRCANCHDAAANPRVATTQAPHLDSDLLLTFHQRRGGPPSKYDQAAFCRVLRTGIDPASILISREMPVYQISDAQCASLWTYLSGEK